MAKLKVLIGLSGGVDSAVGAYLLMQQGYDVTGCFMRNWDALANNDYLGNPTINDNQCPQEKDYEDAKKVAEILGIKLLRIDFIKEYWDYVFSYFLDEYKLGRTPNPDIFCNKYIKFDAFLKFAKENGFDYIAMGHYAKKEEINGVSYLLKPYDKNKDQTYFLSQINQEQLKSCLFPLADVDKNEVRRLAHKLNLSSVMDKKDSTGICFIGERNFKKFLNNYLPAKKGKVVDIETDEVIGEHDGVLYYTIGQHKGIGIGGIKNHDNSGWFVVKKDVKNNVLYVASGSENPYLYSDYCYVRKINLISRKLKEKEELNAKFRYRQKDMPVTVSYVDENTLLVVFKKPYKAITPGQACVLYDGDICLGGGIIDEVYKKQRRVDQ